MTQELEKTLWATADKFRNYRMLNNQGLDSVASTYDNWKNPDGNYANIPVFRNAPKLKEVETNNFVLTRGRYVGFEVLKITASHLTKK